MLKRALAVVGTLTGLVLVIVGVMGFVLLGPSGTWHSEVTVPAGRTAVVIEPALASVLGPRIRIEAKAVADPGPLFVGWARPDDTAALLRDTAQFRLTGLDGVRDVRVSSTDGSQLLPAPDSLDIWHSQTVGARQVTLSYRAQPGADTVVIARADGAPLPALAVRLHWIDRSWLWFPGLLVAAGLVLLLLMRPWLRPTERVSRRSMAAASARRRRASAVQGLASSGDAIARTGRRAGRKATAVQARRGSRRRDVEPVAPDPSDVDHPVADQPVPAHSTVDYPTVDHPTVAQPAVDHPTVEQPAVDHPTVEQPAVDHAAVDHPTVEQPGAHPAPATRIGRRRAAQEEHR